MRASAFLSAALALGVPALPVSATSAAAGEQMLTQVPVPAATRQAELLRLVRQDCGSCHGLQMEGGLGLPLTPRALADKPPEALVQTVLHGRRGTAMPPWSPFLSENEAGWVVEILLQGLPDAR